MSAGRPTKYSAALATEICARIAEGRSARSIGKDDDMPGERTIFAWLAAHAEFQQQYARAKELAADRYFEEIVEIADAPLRGERITYKADGTVERVEADMIEHRRLQVDARKWSAARLAPKKYGDKLDLNHGGEVRIERIERVIVDK